MTIEPSRAASRCEYCGTRFRRSRPHAHAALPSQEQLVEVRSNRQTLVIVSVMAGALIVAAIGALVAQNRSRSSRKAGAPVGKSSAAPSFRFDDRPMLLDVDHDGVEDLIGACRDDETQRPYWVGAFSGKDGKPLWRSQRFGRAAIAAKGTRVVVGDRVAVVEPSGMIHMLDGRTGAQAWEHPLYGAPGSVCADGDALVVESEGERHVLALADGARRRAQPNGDAGPSPCLPVYQSGSDEAPNAWTVSAIPEGDAGYRKQLEMGIERVLVPTSGTARVVLGESHERPARLMVGVVSEGQVLWQSTVPVVSPKNTRPFWPRAAVRRSRIVVPYEVTKPRSGRLTCFELETGVRQWDIEAPAWNAATRPLAVSRDGQIFLSPIGGRVAVYGLSDGTYRFFVGNP